jgi:hypothetical protein
MAGAGRRGTGAAPPDDVAGAAPPDDVAGMAGRPNAHRL